MTSLPASTLHRLQQLPQNPSVWEGDRRALAGEKSPLDIDGSQKGDCILWVDGSEGFVRSMDVVSPETGLEAVVRTLIRAMETPHRPATSSRPQKIVVRNREIQFFLRGALQGLDIAIDYVPELPLIDELFRSFEAVGDNRPPSLPPLYEKALKKTAAEFWEIASWDLLADSDIIAIELDNGDVSPVYACIMGMLGQEYGAILYRSLESIKQFRHAAVSETSNDQLEQAFLSQDCWFLNYEGKEEEGNEDLGDLSAEEVESVFGSIHPLEGIRPFLDEAEAKNVYYILQGFIRFFQDHEQELSQDPIGLIHSTYVIEPLETNKKGKFRASQTAVTATVYTMPDLAAEFCSLSDDDDDDDGEDFSLGDDLIPENAFLSIGMVPWEILEELKKNPKAHYQHLKIQAKGEGLPVVVVQTTRPKAQELIKRILSEGGITGLCFTIGENPLTETNYDLGILQLGDDDLYLFGEFLQEDSTHKKARKKWDDRCKISQGHCGVLIAMGVTGGSRGKPKLPDMLAFFEVPYLSPEALGLGKLQLSPGFQDDW
ncbi:MAG: DUF6930 domain-containing protein [Microcystaceae cyanobacterium]